MGQNASEEELEKLIDPNDPDCVFKLWSDLVRSSPKGPRSSVGAVKVADDLGVCPYCSLESCNHQCWTKMARRRDRDSNEIGDRDGPLSEGGI